MATFIILLIVQEVVQRNDSRIQKKMAMVSAQFVAKFKIEDWKLVLQALDESFF